MKIRTGFVSNSSSSSFTCDYCGNTESGYDISFTDYGLIECTRGHLCCDHHLSISVNDPKIVKAFLEYKPEYAEEEQEDIECELRYEFPSEFCPLCNLEAIGVHDLIAYFKLRFGLTQEEVIDDIKETFGSYEAFSRACRGR